MAHTAEPISPLQHRGFAVPDKSRLRPRSSFVNALLATALFRCWHILIFYAGWSTLITVLNQNGHRLYFKPTLLTVVGTVLGFVISYRTASSFERYNDGRRLWSQIIVANRTLARTIWFHVPNDRPLGNESLDQAKARTLIEKKTTINLLEAFSVAIKHYLRGEDGIYYKDLYHLVKFLPAYALPGGMSATDMVHYEHVEFHSGPTSNSARSSLTLGAEGVEPASHLGKRVSSSLSRRSSDQGIGLPQPVSIGSPGKRIIDMSSHSERLNKNPNEKDRVVLTREEEVYLLPSHMPPKWSFLDFFPLSLLVKYMTKEDPKDKGAKLQAKLKQQNVSQNLPLELSLYLSSYIASLQKKNALDVSTANNMITSLNQLVDALSGLERILTTPIPFSYSVHLWLVTYAYCFFLPFQIWSDLHWETIPGTVIITFFLFGFMVAGEEIENPFGYDKNDLNLDHFTHNIIRNELRAITAVEPPDPAIWAFAPENDLLFSNTTENRITPAEWMEKGPNAMWRSLRKI